MLEWNYKREIWTHRKQITSKNVSPTVASFLQLSRTLTNPDCFKGKKQHSGSYFSAQNKNHDGKNNKHTHLFLIHSGQHRKNKIFILWMAIIHKLYLNFSNWQVWNWLGTQLLPVCHLWNDEMLSISVIYNRTRAWQKVSNTENSICYEYHTAAILDMLSCFCYTYLVFYRKDKMLIGQWVHTGSPLASLPAPGAQLVCTCLQQQRIYQVGCLKLVYSGHIFHV